MVMNCHLVCFFFLCFFVWLVVVGGVFVRMGGFGILCFLVARHKYADRDLNMKSFTHSPAAF